MREEENFDRREFEVDNSFVERNAIIHFFLFWIFSRSRVNISSKEKLNYVLKLSRTTWKISILINPLPIAIPRSNNFNRIYKQSEHSAPTIDEIVFYRPTLSYARVDVLLHRLFLTSPLHGDKRAKRTGREWGLTRVIFDPRNRSRSTSPPVCLPGCRQFRLFTCRYA